MSSNETNSAASLAMMTNNSGAAINTNGNGGSHGPHNSLANNGTGHVQAGVQ
jgi:hypothetical protein